MEINSIMTANNIFNMLTENMTWKKLFANKYLSVLKKNILISKNSLLTIYVK